MPVLYEFSEDHSDTTTELTKLLLQKYDFNPGQRSIIDSANIQADVTSTISFDYQGDTIYVSSKIDSFLLEINVSHEEAVSESINEVYDEIEKFVYTAWEFDEINPVAYSIEQGQSNALNLYQNYLNASKNLGIFI